MHGGQTTEGVRVVNSHVPIMSAAPVLNPDITHQTQQQSTQQD